MGRKNKKQRRPKSALAGIVLSIFAENPFRAYNYKQIAHALGIKDKASRDLLHNILRDLEKAGDIKEVKPGKYMLEEGRIMDLANKKKYVTGTVELKKTGKAYIISDDGGEDIYIAANNVNHALNGDKVKVFIYKLH